MKPGYPQDLFFKFAVALGLTVILLYVMLGILNLFF